MAPVTLSTIVGVVCEKLATARPASLCTAFGLSDSGVLEFHLLYEKTGEAIVISEDTDPMTADILAEDMERLINNLSTTKEEK